MNLGKNREIKNPPNFINRLFVPLSNHLQTFSHVCDNFFVFNFDVSIVLQQGNEKKKKNSYSMKREWN